MKNYMIIYHHKTGCVLSKTLMNLYKKVLVDKISSKINNFNKNSDIKIKNRIVRLIYHAEYKEKAKYNIYYEVSPYLIFNIFNVFNKIDKIIHFIRDPFEQSVSNFTYHTQQPTPEKWFLTVSNNTNSWFHDSILYFMFDMLELDRNLVDQSKKFLLDNYKLQNNLSYYKNLMIIKNKDIESAIILETFRFIFDTSHILKMGCILKKNYKFKNRILNLKITDFHPNVVKKTIIKLSKFLFEEKINNDEYTQRYLKIYQNRKKGNHISNKSSNQKKKLGRILKNNKIIFTILNRINEIIIKYA